MQPAQKGVTPAGILAFSKKLYSNQEKYSGGKFIGTLLLEKGVPANDEFAATRIARHLEAGGTAEHAPVKDGDLPNKDGKVSDYNKGMWVAKFKTGDPVTVRDAKKNKLDPKVVQAKSGDVVRFAWAENIQTKPGQWNGVALYLNGVQLLEKRAADADFEEYEGGFDASSYSAPEGDNEKPADKTGSGFDF